MVLQEGYSSLEIEKHNNKDDLWIIINNEIYDVSKWKNKHPGGAAILVDFAGQDATDAFNSFHHLDLVRQRRLMESMKIGYVKNPKSPEPVIQDFRDLTRKFQEKGYFKADLMFFFLHFMQLIVLEAIGVYISYNYKLTSWSSTMLCAIILMISQAQAGWLQHDFGHIAVFENNKLNNYFHVFIISILKGASANWWKYRHNRHHAKPNILHKDPDLKNEPLFIFGKEMAREGYGSILTPFQTIYWFFLGPPMVTFLFFLVTNLVYVFRWRLWTDLALGLSYIFRFIVVHNVICQNSGWDVWTLYATTRIMESIWFTWITSLSHFPMVIKNDGKENWVTAQLQSSQNFSNGVFENWFSGHLNYQIEHHLFPTMPRHSYPLIADEVQAFLKKHDIEYRKRTFFQAASDVVHALDDASNEYLAIEKKKKELSASSKKAK